MVEVVASEINEDGHVETPHLDADFALVVTGPLLANCTSAGWVTLDQPRYPCAGEVGIRVVDCDLNLIPYSEVIIVNEEDSPLAIGKALLNREEMLAFTAGVAVKVRKGI